MKLVEYSFKKGQANEISDMQLVITDGTENKTFAYLKKKSR